MKNKINFGLSTTRFGALDITNYRIRTVTASNLDRRLDDAWMRICERIGDEDLMYTNHRVSISGPRKDMLNGKYYTTHDFTCCSRGLFMEVMFPIIKRHMLEAEIQDLNYKYESFNVIVRQEVLPSQEDYTESDAEIVLDL